MNEQEKESAIDREGETATSHTYFQSRRRPDAKRIVTFFNSNDRISFRHHHHDRDGKEIKLAELGPRFEMQPYHIKLGTIDALEAETEWVLRPYMNASRKIL